MTTLAVESPRGTLDLPTGFPETASEQLGRRSQLVSG
jgi:hypothetical protein